jgi:LysM repeat protein
MAQKKWQWLFCALPIMSMALSAQGAAPSQAQQGAQTVAVKKHPSRWKYPSEVVVGQGQTLHIVVKGDTFWALGQKYLGTPFAWPQIWELNKWIRDPHWIYPGDPILVPAGRSVIGQGDMMGPDPSVANLQPDRGNFGSPIDLVKYLYNFYDYLRLPYLAVKGANAHFRDLGAVRITGCQKEDRTNLSRGDVVYLEGGQAKGHRPGDSLMVLKVEKSRLMHPDGAHTRPLGDVIRHTAKLRVLSVHPKNSEAVIEDSVDGVEIGDHATAYAEPTLILAKDVPLRRDLLEPIPLKATAKIIYGLNGAEFLSNRSLILIDKGSSHGFKVGDLLLAVRAKGLVNEGAGHQGKKAPMTNRYLGQLLIVRADERYSTCLIVSTKIEMNPGDTVTQ